MAFSRYVNLTGAAVCGGLGSDREPLAPIGRRSCSLINTSVRRGMVRGRVGSNISIAQQQRSAFTRHSHQPADELLNEDTNLCSAVSPAVSFTRAVLHLTVGNSTWKFESKLSKTLCVIHLSLIAYEHPRNYLATCLKYYVNIRQPYFLQKK